jgi:hypothetical protein
MSHFETNLVDISCKICIHGMDGAGILNCYMMEGKGF